MSPAGRRFAGVFATPLGEMLAIVDAGGALTRLEFVASAAAQRLLPSAELEWEAGRIAAVATQMGEYFAGRRQRFDLALAPAGTAFQRAVWRLLLDIPYGATVTYRELANALGRPIAARAVGAANGANPLAVIVPCHRVLGADGSLTGYAGGLGLKQALLELEAAHGTG